MVGSLLKKANLSTPHRPSTCAAIFLFVDAASLWRAEIVKASLSEVNQFTGNCFRVVRIVLKRTFLKLRYPGRLLYPGQRPESPTLSYYGSTLVPDVFLDFSSRKRSRASREAATTSRESKEEREKNLWLPWPRISLSCRRQLSNASNC